MILFATKELRNDFTPWPALLAEYPRNAFHASGKDDHMDIGRRRICVLFRPLIFLAIMLLATNCIYDRIGASGRPADTLECPDGYQRSPQSGACITLSEEIASPASSETPANSSTSTPVSDSSSPSLGEAPRIGDLPDPNKASCPEGMESDDEGNCVIPGCHLRLIMVVEGAPHVRQNSQVYQLTYDVSAQNLHRMYQLSFNGGRGNSQARITICRNDDNTCNAAPVDLIVFQTPFAKAVRWLPIPFWREARRAIEREEARCKELTRNK